MGWGDLREGQTTDCIWKRRDRVKQGRDCYELLYGFAVSIVICFVCVIGTVLWNWIRQILS